MPRRTLFVLLVDSAMAVLVAPSNDDPDPPDIGRAQPHKMALRVNLAETWGRKDEDVIPCRSFFCPHFLPFLRTSARNSGISL
jgi:hypothetical protein